MAETVHVSVRSLVEFLMREGDIDNRGGMFAETALLEGANMHRAIQRKAGAGYRAEVTLKNSYALEGFDITLEGRADGVFTSELPEEDGETVLLSGTAALQADLDNVITWIDEIKTTYHSISFMEEPAAVHMAQAMCYAAMYSELYEEPLMGVRISYCHLDTKEMKFFCSVFTGQELDGYLSDLLRQYEKWMKFRIKTLTEAEA